MSKMNFVELCAGAGGLSSGLIKAGFTPLLLNDIDKWCCETLRKNHCSEGTGIEVKCSPMENLDLSKFKGIDLLVAGTACQAFSSSGLRKGFDDPRGKMMLKFIDMIHDVKPKIFLIENVKGLLTHNKGESIKEVIRLLSANDTYEVQYKVLKAVDFDVPQKRERVFIVGTRRDLKLKFEFPTPVTKIPKTVKDALFKVPKSEGAKYSQEKIELFKLIPQGGNWKNLPIDMQKKYMGNAFLSGGGKTGYLHRLSWDKPCVTLLCSPSQKQTERCHPSEERPLTVKEYARIQTFDDSYEFVGSMASKYKQIGNAVPVELAKHIGLALLKTLKK